MKIALLGSGSIMRDLLVSILASGHSIEAVATNKGADVFTWELEECGCKAVYLDDYTQACDLSVDYIVMFSYAPLIRSEYLRKKNFINIHYALLPRFRGFHGFVWSMINDEKKMGYTVHLVDEGIDSGPVLFQHKVSIDDKQNINDIRNLLDQHLINNLGSYLTQIEQGHKPVPQDDKQAIYVTKRRPEDGLINWNWPARLVFSHIRALTPPLLPGAFSFFKGEKIIFTKAEWIESPVYYSEVGKIVNINEDGSVLIKCIDSVIKITEVAVHEITIPPSQVFKVVGTQLLSE